MGDFVDNRYAVRETLGEGGMAKVYLAHDEVLSRDVAIKVLREQYAEDEEFAERFRREARSAGSLSHPRIVSVYDLGETEDGASYISMEYVSGGTLKDRILRDAPLDAPAAVAVAAQIAEALEAAHERGVIHRDIKPQNVLVTSTGDVKVADFGIARAASAPTMTGGFILGTAAYMSPEQAAGERAEPQSDLYSLGVVLYEMLTGELPHEPRLSAAPRRPAAPPPHPKEVSPSIPDALDALVVRLLARRAADRPRSSTELLDELRRPQEEPRRSQRESLVPETKTTAVAQRTRIGGGRGGRPGRGRRGLEPGSFIPWVLVVLFVVILSLAIRYVLNLLGSPPIP